MNYIGSRTHPLVKHVTSLHTSKGRESLGQFIAEGLRTCKTFIEHGFMPVHCFITQEQSAIAEQYHNNFLVMTVSAEVMEKMSTATTPSGILCVFQIPLPTPYQIEQGLVLAHLQDPGNVGTLIRSAAACGIKTIITINGTDIWSPKVVQASAGALALVHVHRLSWQQLLARKTGKLYALVVENGEPLTTINRENALIVVGNEAHGIPHEWITDCEHRITIPMPGTTESLNVAVAGSIALYITHVYTCSLKD